MSNPSLVELLQDIYTALKDDLNIIAECGARVYNHVPQEPKNLPQKPYIHFWVPTSTDWGPKNELGFEHEIQVDIWSDHRGDFQLFTIAQIVIELLHNQPFTSTNGQNILLQHSSTLTILENDGLTYHGIVRFRALTGQT